MRCARCEKTELQTKHTHSAPTPRPHATLVTIAMQAYVSCNLGRVVTSSRCGSFWSTAALRAFRLLPRCASVSVVNGPKFNLDMIVHSFTSRFSKTTAQYPTTCVLPHTDCVCQRTWSTMPTTCWFGLHTAPMSEDFICH